MSVHEDSVDLSLLGKLVKENLKNFNGPFENRVEGIFHQIMNMSNLPSNIPSEDIKKLITTAISEEMRH